MSTKHNDRKGKELWKNPSHTSTLRQRILTIHVHRLHRTQGNSTLKGSLRRNSNVQVRLITMSDACHGWTEVGMMKNKSVKHVAILFDVN